MLPIALIAVTVSTATTAEDLEPPGAPRRMEIVRVAEVVPAAPADERPDHARVVGSFGVGWFGVSNILVDTSNNANAAIVAAPVLGVRYWISELIGVDGGIGIGLSSSKESFEGGGVTMDEDGPTTFGLMFHAGVPLALKTGRHYTFLVVPELNVGFANIKRTLSGGGGMTPMEVKNSGFRLDVGGRAGAEVHFGFIDVPELALEASVGLYITRVSVSEEQGGSTSSFGQTSVTTSSLNDPWDFFRTTVAARYYF